MDATFNINDIAESLLILNKQTIDRLYHMQNCADCVALYMFYYKTAKWQKTNCIKAVDTYTRKCLNWGSDKLRKTKQILKSEGLIEIIQSRNNQNIAGWYIKINYIVPTDIISQAAESLQSEARTLESKNTRKQEHSKPTNRFQETNALINTNNMLKEQSQIKIKNNKNKKNNNYTEKFEIFYNASPRKHNKEKAYQKFLFVVNSGVSEDLLIFKMQEYAEYVKSTSVDAKYICTPIGWLSARKWEDIIEIPNQFSDNSQFDNTSDFDMW